MTERREARKKNEGWAEDGGSFTTEDTDDTEKDRRKDRKRKTAPLKTKGAAPKRKEKSENPTRSSGVWGTRQASGLR
jgi:hypothetical protein